MHIPGGEATRKWLNAERLARMKPGSIVINSGRGTTVDDEALKALAGRLKKRCGVGGSVKDGVIELQGDHRETVVEVLRSENFDVVLAGG